MHNRPKISSLNEQELAQLLKESFFKIGKDINLNLDQIKILIQEVYKYQGWIYIDAFTEAFSKYAADELPDTELLKPNVSPRFVSKLMKLYFRRINETSTLKKNIKENPTTFTPEEKYRLFVHFIKENKTLPGNCDWVTIYEFLAETKKLNLPDEWASLTFYGKWKYAMHELTDWAHRYFSISEKPLYIHTMGGGPLKGIGSRIGESIWQGKR